MPVHVVRYLYHVAASLGSGCTSNKGERSGIHSIQCFNGATSIEGAEKGGVSYIETHYFGNNMEAFQFDIEISQRKREPGVLIGVAHL